MEKPGRIGGRGFRRGLLSFLAGMAILVARPPVLRGISGPEEVLTVLVKTESGELRIGVSWSLSLLVDHPNPAEVTVRPPEFPEHLILDRIRISVAVVAGASGRDERWTEFRYFLTPRRTGRFVLGSFEVVTPEKRALTPAMTLSALGDQEVPPVYEPVLRWLDLPAVLIPGRGAEILLSVEGGDPGVDYAAAAAAAALVVGEGTLAELRPLKAADAARGGVLRVRLIPLMGTRSPLPSVTLQVKGRRISSPPLTLPVAASAAEGVPEEAAKAVPKAVVLAAARGQSQVPQGVTVGTRQGAAPGWPEALPDHPDRRLPGLGSAYRDAIRLARSRWDAGDFGAALAGLRAAERDSLWGWTLRPLRRALESALGLSPGPDELLAPVSLLLSAAAVSVAAWLFFRKSAAGSYFFAALALASILYLAAARLDARGNLGRGRGVVLLDCESFKVPDPAGAPAASFSQGQYGRIRIETGPWSFVETQDGQAGWIAGASAIRY